MEFNFDAAFSRTLGWITQTEQTVLRAKRVALAGMGGVGGSHLLTHTRLGVGKFNIADFDEFEIHNFNRQAGASLSHLNRPKVDVMAEMALDINPLLEMKRFPAGVTRENLDEFLDEVDLYVDSLDFFAFEARQMVFAACARKGIPAITAAPLGMGAAFLCFLPGGMTFEQYFQLEGHADKEKALRLMLGLSPALLQMGYLVDDSRVDFEAREGPSTPMACEICAGVAATHSLKILLNRGGVPAAPHGVHYDAYRNKLSHTWRPWGNRNPIQKLGLAIARSRVMAAPRVKTTTAATPLPDAAIYRILDLARWAPSGDNEQPWRFEVVDAEHFVIHTRDTRDWCIYDLDGSSSQIAVGALLENIAIAASGEGLCAEFRQREGAGEAALLIDVNLRNQSGVAPNRLLPYIRSRVTQRRPFSTRSLTDIQKRALESAAGEGYRVIWLEGARALREMARLLFHSAHIRLTAPEAYEVHRKNIEWRARFSEDRIPEYAVGVDVLTGRIMQWVLRSWGRVKFLNRFLAGTWLPRLQMDLLPGLRCAAHFVIVADRALQSPDDYVTGGRAMQRFWLEATRQGLQFQPEMTPLIFSRYVAQGVPFTRLATAQKTARKIADQLASILKNGEVDKRVYMGRIGFGEAPTSRSIRPQLSELLIDADRS